MTPTQRQSCDSMWTGIHSLRLGGEDLGGDKGREAITRIQHMEKKFNKKVKGGGGEGEDDYENDKDDGRH